MSKCCICKRKLASRYENYDVETHVSPLYLWTAANDVVCVSCLQTAAEMLLQDGKNLTKLRARIKKDNKEQKALKLHTVGDVREWEERTGRTIKISA